MKFFTELVLLSIVFVYSFMVSLLTFRPYYEYKIIEPNLMRNSYIAEIKGDLLDIELTKKHLDNFNQLGNNKILRYKVTEHPRPITIEIRALGVDFYEEINKDAILAYAQSDERGCKIVVRNDLVTETQFRNTLIHEFLHCYSYDHVNDEQDLMYSEDNPDVDMEPSIRKYAKEVEERIK